jgi:hypothetical protein
MLDIQVCVKQSFAPQHISPTNALFHHSSKISTRKCIQQYLYSDATGYLLDGSQSYVMTGLQTSNLKHVTKHLCKMLPHSDNNHGHVPIQAPNHIYNV